MLFPHLFWPGIVSVLVQALRNLIDLVGLQLFGHLRLRQLYVSNPIYENANLL